jgi:CheY-like chemotaxis protein
MQTTGIRNTVLCVDGEDAPLGILQSVLMANGYGVLTATDGLTALKLMSARRIDAIVLNYSTPNSNSQEFAAQAKRLRPSTPILLLSKDTTCHGLTHVDAFAHQDEGFRGLLAGLRRLLQTPVNHVHGTRRFSRFPVQVPMVVTVIRSGKSILLEGVSHTIGEGGLGGKINGRLIPGEYVRIRIIDRRLGTALEPRAQVLYRKDDNYGFSFLDVSLPEQASVRRLFSQPAL